MKRILDIVVSSIGLICLFPLLLVVALLIKLDSTGPVFFGQTRMGRRFRPFQILKFRTMVQDSSTRGKSITVGDDARITRVGWFLRRPKSMSCRSLSMYLEGK